MIAPEVKINEQRLDLFSDDLLLTAPTKDPLQKLIFYLDKVVTEHGGKISAEKAKRMAHREKVAVRTKIILRLTR